MKLLFPKQNYNLSPNAYLHTSVKDLYISRIGLPILLQGNLWTDPRKGIHKWNFTCSAAAMSTFPTYLSIFSISVYKQPAYACKMMGRWGVGAKSHKVQLKCGILFTVFCMVPREDIRCNHWKRGIRTPGGYKEMSSIFADQ
jgi:hypothetical protein